jgi:hypothetical protein
MFDPASAALAELRKLSEQYDADQAVENYLRNRARAYRAVFSTQACTEGDLEFVMLDLAHFCRAFTSAYAPDQRDHALLEGRREVFLRIFDHVSLSHDVLMQRYAIQHPKR